jgi:hypothetical protein
MGKGSKPTIGFWYHVAYHHGLTIGPIDAFLEFRGGDKTAWKGELTASGTIHVNAPMLWGGEKDQGGIVGDLDVMFGEPTQAPNPYLVQTFGNQTAAWRGFATVAFKGGRYGAMNPYPQKPSYKFRQIASHWDDPGCWYPEKAEISMPVDFTPPAPVEGYWQVEAGAKYTLRDQTADFGTVASAYIATADQIGQNAINARNAATGSSYVFSGSQYTTEMDGDPGIVAWDEAHGTDVGIAAVKATPVCPTGYDWSVAEGEDTTPGIDAPVVMCALRAPTLLAINPAHVLYYSRTNADMGREDPSVINDASLRAAADKLYAEGFGICPSWDPASESVEDFEKRICKLIGGSFTRSLEDGQWYLDLARGDYVLDDLPILTDDDILDFKEQPTVLDNAVNSVSVRYKDPEKKETIVTAPTRALGLVAAFGTIHQTTDYPSIPTGGLAARIALRDVLGSATPTRAFDLVTTRRTYAWRPNTYFRLQSVKRGIADMVCIVGEKDSGTLKSGAIKMKAAQDIYSLPSTSFVQVEPGVDTRPPQTPTPITAQRAIEAPYVEIAAMLTRADLAALPADVGYAMAVAANPAADLDYTMMVADASGDYVDAGRSEWCATATVVDAAGYVDAAFTLAGGAGLDRVEIGMGALWESEIVRVDAIDVAAGTITLGRGCADTVPQMHAAGTRLWFYPTGFAYDATEFTAGETVNVKLLANTGSQQQLLDAVTAMPVTFDQRQARPYPPAGLRINGEVYPSSTTGPDVVVAFVPRDRLMQADQLIDTTAAGIGPEAGTTFTLRGYLDNALVHTEAGAAGSPMTWTPGASGDARVEVDAVVGGLASWQPLAANFTFFDGSILEVTGTFAAGNVGVAYSSSLPITGGVEPYTLTGGTGIASGSLDSGFTLSITGSPGAYFLTLSNASPSTADTMTFVGSVDSDDGQTATTGEQNVTIGDSLYLDGLSVAPIAVLSLKRLVSTATVAIRVRRSSDNTEQDIGFTGDALDTTSLLAFAGAGSAYVTTIYDQAGAFDAVQATTTKQPRIVNAGTYDGALIFNGTSTAMSISSLTMGTQRAALYAKLQQPNDTQYHMLFELSSDGQATAGGFNWYGFTDNLSQVLSAGNTGGGRSTSFHLTSMTALTQATALFDRSLTGTAETVLRVAGTALSPTAGATGEQTGNFVDNTLHIGARAGTSLFSTMKFESVAVYTADTSSIRTDIESIIA